MFNTYNASLIKCNNPEKLTRSQFEEIERQKKLLAFYLSGNFDSLEISKLDIWKAQNVYILNFSNEDKIYILIDTCEILKFNMAVARFMSLVNKYNLKYRQIKDYKTKNDYKIKKSLCEKDKNGVLLRDYNIFELSISWIEFDECWKGFEWENAETKR